MRLHAGNAAAAASVAAIAWATDASGAPPTSCSVAGLTIGIRAPLAFDPVATDQQPILLRHGSDGTPI